MAFIVVAAAGVVIAAEVFTGGLFFRFAHFIPFGARFFAGFLAFFRRHFTPFFTLLFALFKAFFFFRGHVFHAFFTPFGMGLLTLLWSHIFPFGASGFTFLDLLLGQLRAGVHGTAPMTAAFHMVGAVGIIVAFFVMQNSVGTLAHAGFRSGLLGCKSSGSAQSGEDTGDNEGFFPGSFYHNNISFKLVI